jgi:predicted porin
MRKLLACLLLLVMAAMAATPAGAAPLFPDVPNEHWARDAVADLASKGIVEGYPDGTFKGDRTSTRWEMALMLSRLLAKGEQAHTQFASKTDLETLKTLALQLKDELDALGVRTQKLETATTALNTRVDELERVRFYGYVRGLYPFIDVRASFPNLGTTALPVVDWTNGRLLISGNAGTTMAKLGTKVRATKDSSFGIEVVGFNSYGDSLVASYWGLTPPVLSNPFTAQGTATPFVQSKNNIPWTRVTLDRFWYRYHPTDTTLIVGSFLNERTDNLILKGERNPNFNPPEILPFYGIDVKGRMNRKEDTPWDYEVSYSRLPQASLLQTQLWAGTVRYAAKNWKIGLHYTRGYNRGIGDGVNYAPGSAATATLPAYPVAPGNIAVYWRNRFGSIISPKLGLQDQHTYGLDLNYRFNDKWSAFGKVSFCSFDPDTTKAVYNTTSNGAAYVIGVKAKLDRLDGSLQYQYVDATYDPLVLQYPGPGSGIPVFLPYSSYYFNYYQLHDYINYPSNRQGAKLELGYNFTDKTRGEVNVGYLQQVKASTLAQFTTVGNVEPLFPYLQAAGNTVRGKVLDWGARLQHKFNDRFMGRLGYFYYNQKRSTFAIDDIDLRENMYYLNLDYKCSQKVNLFGNYYYLDYKGHTGFANQGFRQHIPALGVSYKLNNDTSVGLTYRHYDFKNTLVAGRDWKANSWMFDWKLNF